MRFFLVFLANSFLALPGFSMPSFAPSTVTRENLTNDTANPQWALLAQKAAASIKTCASETISGKIKKTDTESYLETSMDSSQKCPSYLIRSTNAETTETLVMLTTGDSVTATAQYYENNCTVDFASIDYVGLNRLLGKWQSKEGFFTFHDFKSMTFYPNFDPVITVTDDVNSDLIRFRPVQYQYTITSFISNQWAMFLSDKDSTTFATLEFNGNTIILKLFDSENGSMKKTLLLNRNGTEQP